MVFRLYLPEDLPEIYAIEEICFRPPMRFSRRYVRRLVESADTVTWVAEEEGRMAGFAIEDFGRDEDGVFAYIQTIEVLPEMRGRGAGNELLRRLEASALERAAGAIWLHVESQNAGAIRLYEAHGYRCEGRRENYYARGKAGLIYRKMLDAGV